MMLIKSFIARCEEFPCSKGLRRAKRSSVATSHRFRDGACGYLQR